MKKLLSLSLLALLLQAEPMLQGMHNQTKKLSKKQRKKINAAKKETAQVSENKEPDKLTLTPTDPITYKLKTLVAEFTELDETIESTIVHPKNFKEMLEKRHALYDQIKELCGGDKQKAKDILKIGATFSDDEKDSTSLIEINYDLEKFIQYPGYLTGSVWRQLIYNNSKKQSNQEDLLKTGISVQEKAIAVLTAQKEAIEQQIKEKSDAIVKAEYKNKRHQQRRLTNKAVSDEIKARVTAKLQHLENEILHWNSNLKELEQQAAELRKNASDRDSRIYNDSLTSIQTREKELKGFIETSEAKKSVMENWFKNEFSFYLPKIDEQGTAMGNLLRG